MKRTVPPERRTLIETPPNLGLSEEAATQFQLRYGDNAIAERPQRSIGSLVRSAATDPMIWFLLATSVLFGLLGQIREMTVLLVAIIPLLGMDFYLHHRTEASIAGLAGVLASEACVLRDGAERRIGADAVVPGDLAIVSAQEAFPADGVIVAGEGLQVEESSLTGEAYPIAKKAYSGIGEPDEASWCFAGTRLLTGRAHVRILFTGSDTIYGDIVQSVIEGPTDRTPLQAAVGDLVRILVYCSIALCVLLAGVRVWQGFGLVDGILSAATLAVAAIPEEFPVVFSFFLGVGVFRLAKSKALVRRAVAVENIGRVSAICSDKTGTITEGRLVFSDAIAAPGVETEWVMTVAAMASRSNSGDPLDQAILARAADRQPEWTRDHFVPFTEGRRRETALWRGQQGATMWTMKGSPETVLGLCAMDEAERDHWLDRVGRAAATGKKVIGCAWSTDGGDGDEPVDGFRLAGLITVSDPVRAGVQEAISMAREAGIQVIMITGDHPKTAIAIARDAGIADEPEIMLGDDLDAKLAKASPAALRRLSIVARASPAQKVSVVKALQQSGRIVAVTGDGVNDAPALRAADIGIAMGLRGTRSAREVAAIVLMDDNFRTIVTAIGEGRQLFSNLRMSFAFLLMIHLPLVASAALIPLLGYPLLYLPVHIVWLEMLIHPAAILGFQALAPKRLDPRSVSSQARFFGAGAWLVIAATGTGIALVIIAIFILTLQSGQSSDYARAMALVALIVSLAVVLLALSRLRTRAAIVVAGAGLGSAFLFDQIPSLAVIFAIQPLKLGDWTIAAVLGALPALGALMLSRRSDKAAQRSGSG
ncbi:cation-transporting P-type ATPase [Sphingorhabdus soli]|uniref:Cation-transporting P-type ATPase n=1 Tax=Flavisphingopyxis soli TaxID=2601267 RepID=A0A5C6UAB5_9SPHN|nr:cation-transporting P-type ATPase [Sphingorhabdus soli]TXC69161.1 cation-transporting P-type ATPase [Sphingorhabdus soli]